MDVAGSPVVVGNLADIGIERFVDEELGLVVAGASLVEDAAAVPSVGVDEKAAGEQHWVFAVRYLLPEKTV